MPRPQGVFTFDPALGRFRNAGGQLIPDAVVLPPVVPQRGADGLLLPVQVSADDALEMTHYVEQQVYDKETGKMVTVRVGHVAGASTPGWLREMKNGLRQPCEGCKNMIGLGDVTLTSEHTRDWGRARS